MRRMDQKPKKKSSLASMGSSKTAGTWFVTFGPTPPLDIFDFDCIEMFRLSEKSTKGTWGAYPMYQRQMSQGFPCFLCSRWRRQRDRLLRPERSGERSCTSGPERWDGGPSRPCLVGAYSDRF